MAVALLLITHDSIGSSLFATAVNMLGVSPIASKNLVVTQHMDIEQGLILASQMCNELDEGDGVLVVTDIYGSTPSNIAAKLIEAVPDRQKIIVTGVNLPMLVRIMNYAYLNLPDLADKACSSASDSIFIIDKPVDCN
ncbi:MAG: PTS fructose transporter subunit IIA [Gammaproteobacteria bacterium]|nr:PTS fructose transporter subunit IIA [Gammaproteobacteria bacterium]